MATCPKGVEYVLARELRELGACDVTESIAAVYFRAERAQACRICVWTRVASRIVLLLGRGMSRTLEDFRQQLAALKWTDWFDSDMRFAVDFNGTNAFVRNSRFGAQLCKDVISDGFVDSGKKRPLVDLQSPDILVYARLFKNRYSVGLDMAGESLHRRGYRGDGGAAPLKENLAAALLLIADWPSIAQQGGSFIDPMCGSGTLAIEAALIALNIAPSASREHWLLENFKYHDPAAWGAILQEAREQARKVTESESDRLLAAASIKGFDINPRTLGIAKENSAAAGVANAIEFKQVAVADLQNTVSTEEKTGLVLCNPPYGKRLGESDDLQQLYQHLGDWLKRECSGWEAAIFTGNPELGWSTGLRSWRQHHLFNGAIACDLQRYKITADNFTQSRHLGQSVQSGKLQATELSDQAAMLLNRLQKNERRLKSWKNQNGISCYRLYDADLPNYAVAIDKYEGVIFEKPEQVTGAQTSIYFHVQEYAPPRQVDQKSAGQRLAEVQRVLQSHYDVPAEQVFIKQRRKQRGSDQYEKLANSSHDLLINEGGHRFIANLGRYLDTGIFLDHRDVRREIAAQAKGARFLNLFAYTASATVYAAKARARSSVSVDMSKTYSRWARKNFELNGLSLTQHQMVTADCLVWLEEHEKQYELILLDPPSFSNSSRMDRTLDIQRDHAQLINHAARLLAGGGILYFSCNRRGFKLDSEIKEAFNVAEITAQTLPLDFKQKGVAHRCWKIKHVI